MRKPFFILSVMLFMAANAAARGAGEMPEKKDKNECPGLEAQMSSQERLSADWDTVLDGQTVYVTGRLRLVGNEPFSSYVIQDDSGKNWYLDDEGARLVAGHEQRSVCVEAVAKRKKMTLADGRELPDQRILENVRLCEQQ